MFQRLRNVHQLGCSHYIYPGAAHTRFDHCLGVMHVAQSLLKELFFKQPELAKNITPRERECVVIAALLHDLGHGPFSHIFDGLFVSKILNKNKDVYKQKMKDTFGRDKYRHEDMSCKLIDYLFETLKKDRKSADLLQLILNKDDEKDSINLIKALISPSSYSETYKKYQKNGKGWIFEIVCNEYSGMDVDKWDYLIRDSKTTNIYISFNYKNLLNNCRVIDDHICYNERFIYDILLMYRSRYDLFKRVYCNVTTETVTQMIFDVFTLSNDKYKLFDSIFDAKKFIKLTDHIISIIDFNDSENDKNIIKAKKIIERIAKRQFYKCVGYDLLYPKQILDCVNNVNSNKGTFSTAKINYKKLSQEWQNEIYQIMLHEMANEMANNKEKEKESDKGGDPKVKEEESKSDHDNSNENDKAEDEKFGKDSIVLIMKSLSFGMETKDPILSVFIYNHNEVEWKKEDVHLTGCCFFIFSGFGFFLIGSFD